MNRAKAPGERKTIVWEAAYDHVLLAQPSLMGGKRAMRGAYATATENLRQLGVAANKRQVENRTVVLRLAVAIYRCLEAKGLLTSFLDMPKQEAYAYDPWPLFCHGGDVGTVWAVTPKACKRACRLLRRRRRVFLSVFASTDNALRQQLLPVGCHDIADSDSDSERNPWPRDSADEPSRKRRRLQEVQQEVQEQVQEEVEEEVRKEAGQEDAEPEGQQAPPLPAQDQPDVPADTLRPLVGLP